MFSYIVGLVACLVLFYNPISELLSPGAVPQIRRTPRPQLNTELLALEDEGNANVSNAACPDDAYSVHIFSREPLVLYIEGFLSVEERAHLLDIRLVFGHFCYLALLFLTASIFLYLLCGLFRASCHHIHQRDVAKIERKVNPSSHLPQ
jgi:hypothetical protein